MNIGDRVRLMSGREEGIVTRILDHDLVEVTIDDFPVPVLRRELVVIAAEEFKAFGGSQLAPSQVPSGKATAKTGGKAKPAAAAPQPGAAPASGGAAKPEKPAPAPPAPKGLYLALLMQTSELLALHLINNTDAEVLYTFGEERSGGQYRALNAGKLAPKAASEPLGHRHLKDFEQWPASIVQLLPSQPNSPVLYDVLLKRLTFKANTFYSSRRAAPVLQREAYLFQLDEKPATPVALPTDDAPAAPQPKEVPAISASQLRDQLAEKLRGDARSVVPAPKQEPVKAIVAPPHEVDLHLEALRPEGAEGLTNTAMLEMQVAAFEDALSRALATGMHEIIFIHGAGNGTLRKELHKRLSRNRDIKFFEEARKEKFGYGATLVRLK
ncbi:Smr/MutS family protein [Hymenobacter sp. B81]|uniref:Smr/MutS family protein n=1 Tax=Hymenobacter sp. B81 TaxID=3344878 RepID=UPI0037DD7D3F